MWCNGVCRSGRKRTDQIDGWTKVARPKQQRRKKGRHDVQTFICAPVKMWDGEEVPLRAALQILDNLGCRPSKILRRWGDWAVTTYGVECLSHPYYIGWNRIWEQDWVEHICEKTWADRRWVSHAFAEARAMPQAKAAFPSPYPAPGTVEAPLRPCNK